MEQATTKAATGDRQQATKAAEEVRSGEKKGYRRLVVWQKAVEGYTHSTRKERSRFYEIARSSLTELEYYIDFAYERLGYLTKEQHEIAASLRQDVGRLLYGLLRFEREQNDMMSPCCMLLVACRNGMTHVACRMLHVAK